MTKIQAFLPVGSVPSANLNAFAGTMHSQDPVERVLAEALEHGYTKAKAHSEGSKGGPGRKRKRNTGPGTEEMYKSREYRRGKRTGGLYSQRVKMFLETAFASIPLT